MGNCLVTKLKAVVDNDNLVPLGALKFLVVSQGSPSQITQLFAILGGEVQVPESYPMTDSTHIANGNYSIIVDDKYDVTSIKCGDSAALVGGIDTLKSVTSLTYLAYMNDTENAALKARKFGDIASLANLTGLTRIQMPHTSVSGDIASLSVLTSLTYINLGNTLVKGDIANLASLTALTSISLSVTKVSGNIAALAVLTLCNTFSISATNIGGSIEEFVSASIESGKNTGSIILYTTRTNITFGGNNRPSSYLSWDDNGHILCGNSTTLAASTILYVSGYTDSEIATNKAAGGIWEGKRVVKVD